MHPSLLLASCSLESFCDYTNHNTAHIALSQKLHDQMLAMVHANEVDYRTAYQNSVES